MHFPTLNIISILGFLGAYGRRKCTDSCRNLNEMLLCASDGRTYKNVCIFMGVFKEINDKIRILYYGKCK